MEKYKKQLIGSGFAVFIIIVIIILANAGYTVIQLNEIDSININNDAIDMHIESVTKLNNQSQIQYDNKAIRTDNNGQMTNITDQLTNQKYQIYYDEPIDTSTINAEIKQHQELLDNFQTQRDNAFNRGNSLHDILFKTLLATSAVNLFFLIFFTENKKKDTQNTDE